MTPADRPSPIEPALTPEMWRVNAFVRRDNGSRVRASIWLAGVSLGIASSATNQSELSHPDDLRAAIALANAALRDSDPRKITWEIVDALRESVEWGADHDNARSDSGSWQTDAMAERVEWWHAIADLLASYLPPRTPESP